MEFLKNNHLDNIKGTVEVWNMLHHHFCYAPYWPEWLYTGNVNVGKFITPTLHLFLCAA